MVTAGWTDVIEHLDEELSIIIDDPMKRINLLRQGMRFAFNAGQKEKAAAYLQEAEALAAKKEPSPAFDAQPPEALERQWEMIERRVKTMRNWFA